MYEIHMNKTYVSG